MPVSMKVVLPTVVHWPVRVAGYVRRLLRLRSDLSGIEHVEMCVGRCCGLNRARPVPEGDRSVC